MSCTWGPAATPHTFAPDTHLTMQDQAEKHVREAAAQGANIILLQVRLGSARQRACCRITAEWPQC